MKRTFQNFFISTAACLFLLPGLCSGQTFRFRHYGVEQNLPSRVIYTLNQDKDGYLWIGTTEGISRFDGFNFFNVSFPDSATGRYPTVSLRDRSGVIWFGCSDGTLFHSSGRILEQLQLPGSSGAGISSIIEDRDGIIYVISQRSPVFAVIPGKPREVRTFTVKNDPNIFSASLTKEGDLVLGTRENLIICSPQGDSLTVQSTVEGFDYSRIMAIKPAGDSLTMIIGTDGNGVFRLSGTEGNYRLTRFPGHPELESISVRSIDRDNDGNLWVSTSGLGIARISLTAGSDSLAAVKFFDQSTGLAGDNVSLVFHDLEGNIWIGYNGSGLSVLGTESFGFFTPGEGGRSNDIIFAGRSGDNYILGTPDGYYIYDQIPGTSRTFIPLPRQAGRNEISSYCIDEAGNILIGTKGSGLFSGNSKEITQIYRSGESGADYITSIKTEVGKIWLATLNGVSIISGRTKALIRTYNMDNGLPHNSINQILLTGDGSGYIATESDRLFRINPDSGITSSDATMYGTLLNKIVSLTRDNTGTIWAATQGNGVFECFRDSVKPMNTSDGLLSNYAYSILADSENNIWVGHESGFSRYDRKSGLVKVYSTDFAKGGSCNPNALFELNDRQIYIGTTEGLIIYDRSRDIKSDIAPVNNINHITINDVEYPLRQSYTLPYRKRYNLSIGFTGINFRDPGKVYYSTFLENYDNDWTTASLAREVTYNLRDGRYKFNLLSVNEDGLTQDNPLTIEFFIKKPFWRTWWFILSGLVIVTGMIILIIREREKAQKKIQDYLENELEARTRVVMKQKAEIELQNLEITDSINYAKRIQSSILPDLNRLKDQFSDAFIMLYPRDIVSGDFYWFDRVDDDRFVVVCADSTGHGVPGAFMSMIGSTLLRDIVTRQKISTPSEILKMLDRQIFSTLNQNLEVGVSNDGMDVVVCEFTLSNRHLRFASAMRPVLLVMGGETYYIKGNRASVGGQAFAEKYFDDQEYYLNEGDTIYLFSDGLPDQFGGPDGKKMKIIRLKKFIGEVYSLPISRQKDEFNKFYEAWKGGYEQVDDILLMGVRV